MVSSFVCSLLKGGAELPKRAVSYVRRGRVQGRGEVSRSQQPTGRGLTKWEVKEENMSAQTAASNEMRRGWPLMARMEIDGTFGMEIGRQSNGRVHPYWLG